MVGAQCQVTTNEAWGDHLHAPVLLQAGQQNRLLDLGLGQGVGNGFLLNVLDGLRIGAATQQQSGGQGQAREIGFHRQFLMLSVQIRSILLINSMFLMREAADDTSLALSGSSSLWRFRLELESLLVRSELNRNFSPENFSYLGKCVNLSD